MDTKLTLKLDKQIIDKAKAYARQNNTSLSQMVENYFKLIATAERPEGNYTPLVQELSGVIELPRELDPAAEYVGYLLQKYS